MMNINEILFNPYQLNNTLQLKNRILMAPMTRSKSTAQGVPTQAMADYYAKRAEAGLIITEGTIIRPDGKGYSDVPGIYTTEQIAAWKKVTAAVHANKGLIFLQIWHVGRVSHPHYLNGELPIAPSATLMNGHVARGNGLAYGQSRAVTTKEIKVLINDFRVAAENARAAGFDGVEIHGANGYLIDQFLHYHTNHRQDEYGNTPENMARFALEIVKACGEAIGYERVGLRLSPGAYLNDIKGDVRDATVFEYLLQQLNILSLAYLHTGNFDDSKKFPELNDKTMTNFMRPHYNGTLIACGGYTSETARQAIVEKNFDLVAFGKPFIANPDLVQRLQDQQVLKTYDVSMLNQLN